MSSSIKESVHSHVFIFFFRLRFLLFHDWLLCFLYFLLLLDRCFHCRTAHGYFGNVEPT